MYTRSMTQQHLRMLDSEIRKHLVLTKKLLEVPDKFIKEERVELERLNASLFILLGSIDNKSSSKFTQTKIEFLPK